MIIEEHFKGYRGQKKRALTDTGTEIVFEKKNCINGFASNAMCAGRRPLIDSG